MNQIHKPKRNSPERKEMLRLRRQEQLSRNPLAYREFYDNQVESRDYYRSAVKASKSK